MDQRLPPFQIIDAMARERSQRSDSAIIDELNQLPPLADEGDACWDDDTYWTRVAYPYLALAQLAAGRRLRAAIRPLLDRACFGDPGEIMRGLRHSLEAIVNPDWSELADICIAAIKSGRLGTVLWAVDQLLVLEDVRAKPVLQKLVRSKHEEIAWRANAAIERLDQAAKTNERQRVGNKRKKAAASSSKAAALKKRMRARGVKKPRGKKSAKKPKS